MAALTDFVGGHANSFNSHKLSVRTLGDCSDE